MASYHSSFTYLNKNSSGEGFVIASFEPDSGFVDSFLGMEQITADSYNGIQKHFYGSKYNSSAEISITLVKPDGSDFSMEDNRRVFRWLTGNRQASWLDFYVGDQLVYSFYGNITACQQQKLDARVIGIQATFTSIHPWAYSAPQLVYKNVGNEMLVLDTQGIVYKGGSVQRLGIDNNGTVYNDETNESIEFNITEDGVIYSDASTMMSINNQTDDLYSYIDLNIVYQNRTGTSISIKNITLGEESIISGIEQNETVTLSAGQFITSSTEGKIFGDDFNFIWTRLLPGNNTIVVNMVDGNGKGTFYFTYRYPVKIGDCAIDIENLGRNPMCEGDISGAIGSVDGINTLARKNVILIDRATGVPYSAYIKDGCLHISNSNDNRNNRVMLIDDEANTLHEIVVNTNTFYLVDAQITGKNTTARKRIVLIDEVNGDPYELIVKDNTPNNLIDKDYGLYISKI